MKRGPIVIITVLLVGAATSSAADCPGIAPETAQRLFEHLKGVSIGDDYRFDGLGTEGSEMVVLWSHRGDRCPAIRVGVENCDSTLGFSTLAVNVPQELAAQCPELQTVVNEIKSAIADEHPVGQYRRLPPEWRRFFAGGAALLALFVFVARRLRKGTVSWQPDGWDAIGGLSVLALALPWFFNVIPAATAELALAWVGFVICLRDHRFPSPSRVSGARLLVLFGLGCLLSWLLSSGGPGDLHLNLSAIWSPELDLRWGPAPISLFRVLGMLVGDLRDTQIIWVNLGFSALVPVLVYLLMTELDIEVGAAFASAIVLALHPLLIAFSGVLERQPLCLFAMAGSALALTRFLKRGGAGQLAAWMLGTVLAITSRPEAAQVLVLHGALLLFVPASRRLRAAAGLGMALLGAGAVTYTRHALTLTLAPTAGPFPWSAYLWTVLLDPNFTPLAWIVAAIAGLLVGLRLRGVWVAISTLVGLDALWRWSSLYIMFVGQPRQVASSRYETILLIPFAIAIAAFLRLVPSGRSWRAAAAAVLVVATIATYRLPYQTLLRDFTVDYEYRFLKRQALSLPGDARLYVFDSVLDDLGFSDAGAVGKFVGSPVEFRSWPERDCDDLIRSPNSYVYIGSSCGRVLAAPDRPLAQPQYDQWLDACAAMRARLAATVLEEIDVPARKMSWNEFKEPVVTIGVYRLTDPSLCAVGPRLPAFHPEQARHQRNGSRSEDGSTIPAGSSP